MNVTTIDENDLLSPEEERELSNLIRAGLAKDKTEDDILEGVRAKHKMTLGNLRLVAWVAKPFRGKGLSYADLLQEGVIGLLKACERFDPTKGVRFSTYATWWIKQAIRIALGKNEVVRVPAHMVQLRNKYYRLQRRMKLDLGIEPTFDQVADKLKVKGTKRELLIQIILHSVSVDQMVYEVADEGRHYDPDANEHVHKRLASLRPQEREWLVLRYGIDGGEPMTLRELGDQFNVSYEWVRIVEKRALKKIAS